MAEREIKYRGLKKFQIFGGDTKKVWDTKRVWIYGFYLKRGTYGDPGPQAHIFVYENGYEGYRVEAETIGQFTGIFDKDGKEIYEDDIIKFADGRVGIVEFEHGCFILRFDDSQLAQPLREVKDWQLEVIGNRFENPELLTSNPDAKNFFVNEQSLSDVEIANSRR